MSEIFSEENPFNGTDAPLLPAPLNYDQDTVGKQRKAIRDAFEVSLQDNSVRAALSWLQQRGKTTGHLDTDAILCWMDVIKVAPDNLRRVLMQGDFMAWERAKMMKHVLKRYYIFENGKMTGELLSLENKSANGEAAANYV